MEQVEQQEYRNSTLYGIAGTRFFRLNSSKIFDIYGTNLQNIEKSVRKIYWADEGKKLVQCDQSGAEALIVAYLCKNGQFRSLFLNGIKPHVFVALHLFARQWQDYIDKSKSGKDIKCNIKELTGTPISLLTTNPFWSYIDKLIKSSDNWPAKQRYYFIAKQVCHSSNYGIGPNKFILNTLEKSKGQIVLTKRDAEFYLEFYHGMFPEIREWHQDVLHQVETTNYLFNLLGFPIYFFHKGEIKQGEFKEYFSAIAQSTVGCITRQAFIDTQNHIETNELNWDLLQDNHDSLMSQCPENQDIECGKVLKRFIEVKLTSPRGEQFQMKSEVQSGYNWSPYKANSNPEGLQELNVN